MPTKYKYLLIEKPKEGISRVLLNRPEKRNAMFNPLRKELFSALEELDRDQETRVIILGGAGKCFSAGYDLGFNVSSELPYHSSTNEGFWPRHVVEGAFKIWDLSTPVVAQVHGYCLAGGTELATSCDLVYVAKDAEIGYPVVRAISPPDNQFFPWLMGMRNAMEMMLTGDSISGEEAVEQGFANKCFSEDKLSDEVLKIAEKIAKVPPEIQAINKRAVHRQMEVMGMRTGIRFGTELQSLSMHTKATREHLKELSKGITDALNKRDKKFGDYRTSKKKK